MFDGTNLTLITDVDQDKSANNLGRVRVPDLQINNLEKTISDYFRSSRETSFEWDDSCPVLDSH